MCLSGGCPAHVDCTARWQGKGTGEGSRIAALALLHYRRHLVLPLSAQGPVSSPGKTHMACLREASQAAPPVHPLPCLFDAHCHLQASRPTATLVWAVHLPPPCRLAAPAALLPTLVFGCPCPWSSAGWQDAWQPAVYSRGGSRQRGAAASMQRVLAGGLGAGGGGGPQPSPGSNCQFRCPSLVGAPAQPRLAAAAEAHAAGASAGLSGRGAPACTFLCMPCRLPACMPSGFALQQQQLTWKG
jgi:hypothetical protein